MQNLSLPIKQAAALKFAEEASKNNTNAVKVNQNSANSSESSDARTSFQMMLNKQVQDKQVQAKKIQENQSLNKQANKPVASKNAANQEASSQALANSKANANEASAAQAAAKNMQKNAKRENDAEKTQESSINETSTSDKDASLSIEKSTNEEVRMISEDAAILAALMQDIAAVNPQALPDTTVKSTINTGVLTENEDADALKSSVDAMFNQKLAKDFQQAVTEDNKRANTTDVALDEGGFSETQTRWMDEMAARGKPADLGQTLNNQAATNQLQARGIDADALKSLASKEDAISELVAKDVSMINNIQSASSSNTTLNNPALATSQLGSSNQIMAYPGKTGWDQAISQKVMWMVGAGEQSATLTLNPPELGPVQVVIHVHNDQADTTFISDNPDVRQALQDGLENLREQMESSGIQLGQANVNAGQQSQQSFQEAAQKQLAGSLRQQTLNHVAEPASNVISRTSNGLVDTFA